MWPNPQFPADLVTFTGEILTGKLQFLCSDLSEKNSRPGAKITTIFRLSWKYFSGIIIKTF